MPLRTTSASSVADRAALDTNVLVRALMGDHPEHTPRAIALLRGESPGLIPVLGPATLSELVWVLGGPRIGLSRPEIAAMLREVLQFQIEFINRAVVETAVESYETVSNDWDDCLVAAFALAVSDGRVLSFDRGLDRIPGVTRIEP